MSSRPLGLGIAPDEDNAGYQNGFDRAHLNWYSIDPIFYSSRRPSSITDDDVSNLYTRRIFINEIFPEIDIVQGQAAVINSLDLNYYPNERGPYNFDTNAQDGYWIRHHKVGQELQGKLLLLTLNKQMLST